METSPGRGASDTPLPACCDETAERQRVELDGDLADVEPPSWVVPLVEPVQHAEEAVRRDLHIQIRTELTALDAFAHDLLPEPLVLLRRQPCALTEPSLEI